MRARGPIHQTGLVGKTIGQLALVLLGASVLVAGLGLATLELLADPVMSAHRHDYEAAEASIDEVASLARAPIDVAIQGFDAVQTDEARRASCGNWLDGPSFDHRRDFLVATQDSVETSELLLRDAALRLATAGWEVDLDPIGEDAGVLSIGGTGSVGRADGTSVQVELDLRRYTASPRLSVVLSFPDLEAASCD